MIIAIASGKGGTGKTTVSVNLSLVFEQPVQLLDCDVEAPNAHLFLREENASETEVTRLVPEIDESLCDHCGECSRFCEYHAIVNLKTTTMVFPELCHSCGGCELVCPRNAIREAPRRIGVIKKKQCRNISLTFGQLDIGVAMAPPLIRAVKAQRQTGMTAVLDAPPGTSCPVITTISGADLVLLVTEPTPFGLHDLSLAVEMVRTLQQPFAVAVNRMGVGDDRVHDYCREQNIPILLEIPDDRRIAELYARGTPLVDSLPEYRQLFVQFRDRLLSFAMNGAKYEK